MPSAVSPSIMSQPVKYVSAPRLTAPRRNPRRLGSGISFAASFIKSFGSTPGMILRWRICSPLTPDNHCAQALWHDQRQRYMHDKKTDDCSHREKMHISCRVITAKHSCQFLKLDRFPNRNP